MGLLTTTLVKVRDEGTGEGRADAKDAGEDMVKVMRDIVRYSTKARCRQ